MKTWVLYYSKGGNTKKIADEIADELEDVLKSEQIPPAYPPENVALLFLGTGEYGGKPDSKTLEFVRTLNKDRVKNVAVFGTNGKGTTGTAIDTIKSLLKEKGINVIDESFCCKGKFFVFFNRKNPDTNDFKAAREYARRVYNSIKA
ncbi:flavodoxin family protein [Ruminiclostridium cellulolyticum]|uniref:Flavodoxin/nitric oxide synthase n=1 Tax=Ruminiclostridium cellulolyticum (strain ATCC 35319 / DSM 5812 / JCM 6584 / H10) TaxID=394503 RepID=B8I6A7_RUMCH|nr:flavodoxin family protein [Ruminiclostridium cellulolyticum]ACL76872.1 flavodoxin/nitric oxide synthase [Ruminiclostridium cellulolyticum H10]